MAYDHGTVHGEQGTVHARHGHNDHGHDQYGSNHNRGYGDRGHHDTGHTADKHGYGMLFLIIVKGLFYYVVLCSINVETSLVY